VCEETTCFLARADTLYTALPGLQPSSRRLVTLNTAHNQFRCVIHAAIVRLWAQQRLRIELVLDGCAIA
jgi:hypothetical protein